MVAVALPLTGSRYYIDLGTLVLTYIMLGWGLNIVVGLAGLLDLGYVAFYAVGAYSYALLATSFGLGFWICLPLAGILAALWGVMLGFPVLRLRGDYLAIVTLAFGEIIRIVLINWVSLTNGPNGITGIPRPTLFGLAFSMDGGAGTFAGFFNIEPAIIQRVIFLYYVILGLALLTNWVSLRLRRMPLGRAWEALREDEVACRSLGINVAQHQADRVRASAPCSAASPARSSPPGRRSSARRASPSSNPPPCWRSSCWAGWAASLASRWRRSSWSAGWRRCAISSASWATR